MCNYHIDWQMLAEQLGMPVAGVKAATAYDASKIEEFAADGIVRYDEHTLSMTDEGALFVRNVAASLDPLMLHTDKSFSKPV